MPESVIHGSSQSQDERAVTAREAAGASPRKILVYRIGSIGDTVIALPAVRAIRRQFPNAHMTFLGNSHEGGHVLAQSVLPSEGLFDEWLTYPTGMGRTRLSRAIIRLFFHLRRSKYDALAYLVPRARSPLSVRRDLTFFYGAGIRHFIGHLGMESMPVRIAGQPQQMVEHESDHLLHRLKLSGVEVPPDGLGEMDLSITDEEKAQARAWLLENCGEGLTKNRLVGFGVGTNWQSKVWPEERFAALGERLVKELDLYPLLIGGQQDVPCHERLLARWGRGVNAAGKLKVRQAAAAITMCRFFVGNDTGTTHLAAAVGTPCVAAYSSVDWPGRWDPYGTGHTILRGDVPCAGCGLRVCDRDLICLKQIEPDEMFDACRRLLMNQADGVKQFELSAL
ncbi:MAG: glycosyltransferase family 9 protein [Acidobacteria bacterium]|nr:glycosyltransferase family 9 protein [Acidobacteriota bacterium]